MFDFAHRLEELIDEAVKAGVPLPEIAGDLELKLNALDIELADEA